MRILCFLPLLSAIVAGVGPASAQPGFDGLLGEQPANPVRVSVESSAPAFRPGDQAVIAVVFDHDDTWHINLNQPVVPEGLEGFVPVPTTITPAVPEADGLVFGRVQWPQPKIAQVDFLFTGTPTEMPVYAGTAVAFVPVRIADDATPGDRSVTLAITYQACDDTTCMIPETIERTVTFRVDPDAAGAASPGPRFTGFDPSVFADPDAWAGGVEPVGVADDTAGRSKFLGLITVPEAGSVGGMVLLAVLAAAGGFVLNLTPCVLPVIPIKIMTISHHAGSDRRRALVLGLWMAAGVVAFWAALGVLAVLATGFADPSRLFGYWWFTLTIGLLILAMGIGIMGAFQIKLPQAVYAVNPKADSAHGSFLFGVMTAVLGLPCFGFVAGALLAGVAFMPQAVVVAIFASIGVGMALPYLVLAAKPGLVKKLPRTGPASELVKQIMGLLMIAAAAYFIGAGVLALLSGMGLTHRLPWWGKAVHWWAIAVAMVVAGGWLAVQTVRITRKAGPRVVFSVVALAFAALGVGAAVNRTDHLRHNFWLDYSSEALAEALDAGSVVVLDFTAEWCLNCKTLEATVLSRDPVKKELLSAGVVPMVADLTSTAAPGWDTLRALGQTGIPLLVVYTPEGGPENPAWMSNAYTPAQVMAALDQARGRTVKAAALPAPTP
jgi:thiol:disulfide interchange protein DsbD